MRPRTWARRTLRWLRMHSLDITYGLMWPGEREKKGWSFTVCTHWVGWIPWFHFTLRTQRLRGRPVRFVTGTDEHGEKIAESAKSADKSPKQHCDEIVEQYKELWKSLDIAYDRFVRTTDEDHEQVSLRCH